VTVRWVPVKVIDDTLWIEELVADCACGMSDKEGMVHTQTLCCRDMPGYNPGGGR